jgi:hypothetical protein
MLGLSHDPQADIGGVEVPQCSSLLPRGRAILSVGGASPRAAAVSPSQLGPLRAINVTIGDQPCVAV